MKAYLVDDRRHRLAEVEPGTLGALHVGVVGPRCSTWVRTVDGLRLLAASQPERPDRVVRAGMWVAAFQALVWLGMAVTDAR